MRRGDEVCEDQAPFFGGQLVHKEESHKLTDDDVAFFGRLIDLVYSILTLGQQQQLGDSRQLVLVVSIFCKLFFHLPNRVELLEQFRDMSIEQFRSLFTEKGITE